MKNELGGSATQQDRTKELGVGDHNGMNRGTGGGGYGGEGGGLNPQPPSIRTLIYTMYICIASRLHPGP